MKTKENNIPERIDYLKCRKELNELGITDKEINTALDQLGHTKQSLTDSQAFENGTPYGNVYEFEKRSVGRFKTYKGEYVKEYTANADFYLIPAQYQGLRHGDIIFKILCNRFNWFNNFMKDKSYKESIIDLDFLNRLDISKLTDDQKKLSVNEIIKLTKKEKVTKKESAWSLYEMHGKDYEMYLTTEFGSLYVPIQALLTNNFKLIEDRMMKYSSSYHDPIKLSGYALNHRGRTKEEYKKDKEADCEKMIKPLISKEAKALKKYLNK